MKKRILLMLAAWMCLSLMACGKDNADHAIVRTQDVTLEDGSVIHHGYDKNNVHISEIMEMPDGSVYEHHYDAEGNHISESSTLSDGSYHEFQYDKDGNIVSEVHK